MLSVDQVPPGTQFIGWVPEMMAGKGLWLMCYKDRLGKILDFAYPTIERTTVRHCYLLPTNPK